MNERIKEIREQLQLSKAEFARRIKITGNAIGNIESGIRNPSNQTISLICEKFNVNEEWLRTGKGNKFSKEKSDSNEYSDPIMNIIKDFDAGQLQQVMDFIEFLRIRKKTPQPPKN